MKLIVDVLSKIDTYGKSFDLNFDNKKVYTTSAGGLFTIITYLIVLSTIWLFGKEMYLKVNPILVAQIDVQENRLNLTFNINMAFTVEDTLGEPVPNYTNYVNITAFKTNFTWSSDAKGYRPIANITNYKSFLCNSGNFSKDVKHIFEKNSLDKAQCFNLSQQLGGYETDNYFYYLTVQLTRCKNTTNDTAIQKISNDQICASNYEIDQFLNRNDNHMTVYYEQIIFDAKNHSKPVRTYIGNDYYGIDPLFCKNKDYFFQELKIVDDDGWLITSLKNRTYQQIDYKKNSFYWKNIVDNYADDCYINTNIYVSEFTTINFRSYIKIADVLAQLGGILNILFQIFDTIWSLLYSRKMIETMINSLFKVKKTDLDEEDIKVEDKTTPKNNLIVEFKSIPDIIKNDNSNRSLKNKSNNSICIIEANIEDMKIDVNDSIINNDAELALSESIILSRSGLSWTEKIEKFDLSLIEHFNLTFFPCYKGVNIKKKERIYDLLKDYISEYTDVINFAKTKLEVEKIKCLLFTPKQIALFNLIPKPENPLKPNLKKKMSILHKYSKDPIAQILKAQKFIENCKNPDKKSRQTKLDKKLLDLFL